MVLSGQNRATPPVHRSPPPVASRMCCNRAVAQSQGISCNCGARAQTTGIPNSGRVRSTSTGSSPQPVKIARRRARLWPAPPAGCRLSRRGTPLGWSVLACCRIDGGAREMTTVPRVERRFAALPSLGRNDRQCQLHLAHLEDRGPRRLFEGQPRRQPAAKIVAGAVHGDRGHARNFEISRDVEEPTCALSTVVAQRG